MMKEKKSILSAAKEAVVKVADRTGDGKIGLDDFGLGKEQMAAAKEKLVDTAAAAGQRMKDAGEKIGRAVDDYRTEAALKALRPVFPEDIRSNISVLSATDPNQRTATPELIRIVDRDKAHEDHEVCVGSIGYLTTIKGSDILNVYKDCAKSLGVYFSPIVSTTVYYIDPFKKDFYVCLDDYFSYLKKERVSELERIAMDLGAKHVKIAYKEQKKTIVKQNSKASTKAGKLGGAEAVSEHATNEYSSVEIAADVKMLGHDHPKAPELTYFKNDSDIENLIKTQTGSGENRIQSKTYAFQCSKFSGISEKTAVKIDAALQQMKCAGSASVASEAQRENRTVLEYTIEF